MKTTLTDNQINVINMPKGFKHTGFDIQAIIIWSPICLEKEDHCIYITNLFQLNIELYGLPESECYTFSKYWFNRIDNNILPDKKGIIKPESLEINFEQKHITIS